MIYLNKQEIFNLINSFEKEFLLYVQLTDGYDWFLARSDKDIENLKKYLGSVVYNYVQSGHLFYDIIPLFKGNVNVDFLVYCYKNGYEDTLIFLGDDSFYDNFSSSLDYLLKEYKDQSIVVYKNPENHYANN